MSGGVIFTTVGRDKMVDILKDKISYFKLGEGGFVLSGETTEVIDASHAGGDNKVEDYTIAGGTFSILTADTSSNYFEFVGEKASFFPDYAMVKIDGSTGNDGLYTVAAGGVSEVGGNTRVVVEETIASAIADGILYVDHLPVAIGPSVDTRHWPMVVEEVTPSLAVVQSVSDTTGAGNLTGDGTGTVNYKTGLLNVTFTSNITSGNIVRTRFKYHNSRMDAANGLAFSELEADSSPIAGDSLHELASFSKEFDVDAQTYIEVRGTGYATIRCHLKIQYSEAIDDGRGASYGGVPYWFEGGIFDEEDVLLAYFTFDKVRKTGSLEMIHTVDFVI